MKGIFAISLLGLFTTVLAHGSTPSALIKGKTYTGTNVLTGHSPTSDAIGWNNPFLYQHAFIRPSELTTSDIICHAKGSPGPSSAKVTAGDTITIQWTPWPSSHSGPILDYLAACNGPCEKVRPSDLRFFKIAQRGLVAGPANQYAIPRFATDELIANGNKWDVTIPKDINPGNYVLRHEILALHFAVDDDGAQFYPQCFNLEVVAGSGSTGAPGKKMPEGKKGTELYEAKHPGVYKLDLHGLEKYQIPGPKVYNAGNNGGNAGNAGNKNGGSGSAKFRAR